MPPSPPLASFGGQSASDDIAPDLAILADFPDEAKRELGTPLAVIVRPELGAESEQELQAFAKRHQLTGEGLVRPLRALRLLLREAAKRGLGVPELKDDLVRLLGDLAPEVGAIVLPHYERLFEQLRVEIVSGTLVDHGLLLVGVDFRVDLVKLGNRGSGLDAPITWLTLKYREGDEVRRISLQVLPDELRRIREIVDEVVGPG